MQKKCFVFLTLVLAVVIMEVRPGPAASAPAGDVVDNLHSALLAVMKDGQMIGFKGRFDQLTPVIAASFDLPFIARTAMGRHWDPLDASQKSRFVETFRRLSIATYAANFGSYSGERFKVVSEKELDHGQFQVRSNLIKSDGGEISLDYILRPVDRQWRIINVIANGVSDLALKRADYNEFLKANGFDALLGKLNEKIAQYSR
jgi:phospholipid transport system substrate-binding protein